MLRGSSFERTLAAPDELEARGRLLRGASLGGQAIENAMRGAAHSAANPLTAHYGLVHGNAVGLLLPHIVRYNEDVAGGAYAELASLCGIEINGDETAAQALARRLERFLQKAGLHETLDACGVPAEHLADLAREAQTQWTARFNPRPTSERDFLEVYRCAF